MARKMNPICIGCNRTPEEIDEYIEAAQDDWGVRPGMTPSEYVIEEDATYNSATSHFACTSCYIRMGMPSSKEGWKAP